MITYQARVSRKVLECCDFWVWDFQDFYKHAHGFPILRLLDGAFIDHFLDLHRIIVALH
jgi:hypothetical protein